MSHFLHIVFIKMYFASVYSSLCYCSTIYEKCKLFFTYKIIAINAVIFPPFPHGFIVLKFI
ncbi:hypothetical protein D3Z45_09080 [Lachnospiraceae bacterium]|nr:hypothetical protein [Lachnospiraceae bacterium]